MLGGEKRNEKHKIVMGIQTMRAEKLNMRNDQLKKTSLPINDYSSLKIAKGNQLIQILWEIDLFKKMEKCKCGGNMELVKDAGGVYEKFVCQKNKKHWAPIRKLSPFENTQLQLEKIMLIFEKAAQLKTPTEIAREVKTTNMTVVRFIACFDKFCDLPSFENENIRFNKIIETIIKINNN
ncbi:unnamed protein product [Caenorhabditis angaria]|uniref:Uncharacterized protein n=1 Tax=Caenorhabditis angaria TaxID=860376 RepID=A0A9P1IIX6_9PELO|nr:unnamed protein product [Caenorhabditis angaria]